MEVTLLPLLVNSWRTGPVLSPGLRPAVRSPVIRTAMVASKGPLELIYPAARTALDDPSHGPGRPVGFVVAS